MSASYRGGRDSQSQNRHVGFVVMKVALGEVFLRELRVAHINTSPPELHTHTSFIYEQCCRILVTVGIVK
jgi:hypothetical protein